MLNGHSNFSVRFFDITKLASGWNPFLRGSYKINSYYRLLAPYFMTQYHKALYLDIDTIVLEDLAKLYNIDLEDNYFGATSDIAAEGFYLEGKKEDLIQDLDRNVEIKSVYKYFQCAVLIVNLDKIRRHYRINKLKYITSMKEWWYIDQDVYNFIAKGKVKFIDPCWNVTATTVVGHGLEMASQKSRDRYLESRRSPFIIHYPGEKKPWLFIDSDLAYAFWDNAKGSPFYEELIVNALKTTMNISVQTKIQGKQGKQAASSNVSPAKHMPKQTNGSLVFRCVTLFHLFNAINLMIQKYNGRKAGVILCDGTDWRDIPDKLTKLNIFDEVVLSHTPRVLDEYFKIDKQERYSSVKKPTDAFLKYGGDPNELNLCNKLAPVTDLFVALNYHMEKHLYYCLVEKGDTVPQIHIYEEGSASYVLNYWSGSVNDGLDHKFYGKNSYPSNIVELLVYEPMLVTMANVPFQITAMPKISVEDKRLQNILKSIFGYITLPKEKVVYFDSPDMADGYLSTGIDILDIIANYVGKENIIVKLHPRNVVNRYELRGYKTIKSECRLWEMAYFDDTIRNKVFVSELSTATITAKTIFGIDIPSINIFRMLLFPKKSFLLSKDMFEVFYQKYLKLSNQDEQFVFTPKTDCELVNEIMFLDIKGSVQNDK